VLGFVELGLAIKFLSNADMVDHWGVLRIEPFLLSWIIIGVGLALYLFGYLHFPHDNKNRRPGPLAIGLGLASMAFVLYLGSGFLTNERSGSYQPLTLLSGLAPPVCYSFFNPCDCPQGLECFKDLEEGLAYAKEVNKPILIDFTGYACVNCRKMEEHVWPTKPVFPHLNDDYVLISLYVDDKEDLPDIEQQTVTQSHNGQQRRLRRVGDKWSHFQAEYFKANTQPYYVLLSPDGQNLLTQPRGYTPNEDEYANFLRCGLENYQRLTETGKTDEQQLGME
jgi:thiol:disulfide interchange protein DsbD